VIALDNGDGRAAPQGLLFMGILHERRSARLRTLQQRTYRFRASVSPSPIGTRLMLTR